MYHLPQSPPWEAITASIRGVAKRWPATVNKPGTPSLPADAKGPRAGNLLESSDVMVSPVCRGSNPSPFADLGRLRDLRPLSALRKT